MAADAFPHGDPALSLHILQNDDPLDIAHYQFIGQRTEAIAKNGCQAVDYVDLIFITRLLERIGDQAVNIAEDANYFLTAHPVRHGGGLRKSACPRPGAPSLGSPGWGLAFPWSRPCRSSRTVPG